MTPGGWRFMFIFFAESSFQMKCDSELKYRVIINSTHQSSDVLLMCFYTYFYNGLYFSSAKDLPARFGKRVYMLHNNVTICLFADDFTEKSTKQDSSTASSQDSEKSKHVDSGLDSTLSFTNKSDDKDSVYESEMGKKSTH